MVYSTYRISNNEQMVARKNELLSYFKVQFVQLFVNARNQYEVINNLVIKNWNNKVGMSLKIVFKKCFVFFFISFIVFCDVFISFSCCFLCNFLFHFLSVFCDLVNFPLCFVIFHFILLYFFIISFSYYCANCS